MKHNNIMSVGLGKLFEKTQEKQGFCPKCDKQIEDYQAGFTDGEMYCYPFECECGHKDNEWYEMKFAGFNIPVKSCLKQ